MFKNDPLRSLPGKFGARAVAATLKIKRPIWQQKSGICLGKPFKKGQMCEKTNFLCPLPYVFFKITKNGKRLPNPKKNFLSIAFFSFRTLKSKYLHYQKNRLIFYLQNPPTKSAIWGVVLGAHTGCGVVGFIVF